jgi:hypothetical protein
VSAVPDNLVELIHRLEHVPILVPQLPVTAPTKMTDFTSSLKSRVSALAENARDLTLDFEAASGSRFFDNDDQTMKEVQTLLTSRLDREKLEALRRLVAVSPLLAQY